MRIHHAWLKKCRQGKTCRPCGGNIPADTQHYLCHGWVLHGGTTYHKFRVCIPCMLAMRIPQLMGRYHEEEYLQWRRERLHDGFAPYVLVLPKESRTGWADWTTPSQGQRVSRSAVLADFIQGRDFEVVALADSSQQSSGIWGYNDTRATVVAVWNASFELWLMMEHDWVYEKAKKLTQVNQILGLFNATASGRKWVEEDFDGNGSIQASRSTYTFGVPAAPAWDGKFDSSEPLVEPFSREFARAFFDEVKDPVRPAPRRQIPPKKIGPKRGY